MRTISLDEVANGDIVGMDLTTDAGTVILAKGSELSRSMISRLKKMNISEVTVMSDDAVASAVERAELLVLLEARFAKSANNPYLCELKRIAGDHLQGI